MPKYAHYNSDIKSRSPVIGWYNTDARAYPSLPPEKDLFAMTEEQWDNRMSRHDWVITNGKLTTYQPPKSLAQLVSEQLHRGLQVTSKTDGTLAEVFAVDTQSQHKLALVQSYIAAHKCFPGGATQYPWAAMNGSVYLFSDPQMFLAFARAVTDYVTTLHIIATTNTGTLPSAEITID